MSQKNTTQLTQVRIDSEIFYQISDVDKMRPFFMSIMSDANHWLFVGSNGGLSAGRKDSGNALFPYYTDDKIIESAETTGSKTIFRIFKNSKSVIWEPFSIRYADLYHLQRNLFKNAYGNKILFEEINSDLGLTFQYQWCTSNSYGFVRKCRLINTSGSDIKLSLLDGIQNILPYGVGSALQSQSSNLVDAYKRNELEKDSGLAMFSLSSIIVDKPEPSEALKANIAWSVGLNDAKRLLSSSRLEDFRKGLPIQQEVDVKAEKGAYFIFTDLLLESGSKKEWHVVADVNKNASQVVALVKAIKTDKHIEFRIKDDIEAGTKRLLDLNASTDGLQLTADGLKDTRHFSNTLFNIARGGIFDNNYQIEKSDLMRYLSKANKEVSERHKSSLQGLANEFSLTELKEFARKSADKDLKRLCLEYLPLKFSRRHGDPSRPWNQFSINTHNEHDGSKVLDYAGNWRDIFQNWEALAHSYPAFVEGMILKFLNASTFDGYNPYRITKGGIDWEKIEPDDPWSYIGYWGDHQIIYLLKFLEFLESYAPGKLTQYFHEDIFVYANVPYKIRSYEAIVKNPKDTIDFDHQLDHAIQQRWATLGADSALLQSKAGTIYHVNFIEKILATVLAKISNFVPEGGIWMNTQRPEWNDANNALVGNGVSVVTLCYLRRFLNFFKEILATSKDVKVSISQELSDFLEQCRQVLVVNQQVLNGKISNKDRKTILDGLGLAGSSYRSQIYQNSFTDARKPVSIQELIDFSVLCLQYLDHTIEANKRNDNLYHAYNLITIESEREASISYLSEMLEGQVAVLSSGYLGSEQVLENLDALKASKLFREDQYSYLLYPDKNLPGFLAKNNIPKSDISSSAFLLNLLKQGNTQIIEQDVDGVCHFNGNFKNASDLEKALNGLDNKQFGMTPADKQDLHRIFEKVFNHKAFTGRSGTFFGYEGLGSIYWHMVSKLQLAVQECCQRAIRNKDDKAIVDKLLAHYYSINEGIGVHKSPSLYGAFPTDPYSHTPANKGAQQPGMTGQVKEDILCRFGELGVSVTQGQLCFDSRMLRKVEFLSKKQVFNYVNVNGRTVELQAEQGSLCFTYCQIPVMYKLAEKDSLEITMIDGKVLRLEGLSLDLSMSQKVFERKGEIVSITAYLNQTSLR